MVKKMQLISDADPVEIVRSLQAAREAQLESVKRVERMRQTQALHRARERARMATHMALLAELSL